MVCRHAGQPRPQGGGHRVLVGPDDVRFGGRHDRLFVRRDKVVIHPNVGSQHSCQPTVKLLILPLEWIFPLGKG